MNCASAAVDPQRSKRSVTVHCAKLSNDQQDLIAGKRDVLADMIKDFERHQRDFPVPADSPSGRMKAAVALFLQQEIDHRHIYGIR